MGERSGLWIKPKDRKEMGFFSIHSNGPNEIFGLQWNPFSWLWARRLKQNKKMWPNLCPIRGPIHPHIKIIKFIIFISFKKYLFIPKN